MIVVFGYGILRYKFLVEPTTERVLDTERKYELKKGESFLVLEKKAKKIFDVFVDFVNHGVCGLCVTRIFPKLVRERYGFEKTPVLWLTTMNVREGVSPENLNKLEYLLQKFLKNSKNSIILFDGLEYLVVRNNFSKVLKFLNNVVDTVALNNSNLLVSLYPNAFNQGELELLKKKLKILE